MPITVLESRRRTLMNVLKFTDIMSVVGVYVLVTFACQLDMTVFKQDGAAYISLRMVVVNLLELLALISVHMVMFDESHMRRDIFKQSTIGMRTLQFAVPLLVDSVIIVLLYYFLDVHYHIILFISLYLLLFPTVYVLVRSVTVRLMRLGIIIPYDTINILIVGSNDRGYGLNALSKSDTYLGFNVVGFIDDDNRCGQDIKMLGKLEDFVDVLRRNVIDTIVICLPIRTYYDTILNIVLEAEKQGVASHYVTTLFSTNFSRADSMLDVDERMMLMHHHAVDGWPQVAKRVFDILGSLMLLFMCSPVMLLAALALRLEGAGPVLFKQARVGTNKRIFKCMKFRTMIPNAEQAQQQLESVNEMDGPVFKIRHDPRVTFVGYWLRKYNIDELPQLFNVLRGEMSIVGPRPMALRDFNLLSDDWARRRFSVKPGLTCTWQVQPHRNSLSFSQWMELDMQYIDSWNFIEDIKICLRTIPAVVSGTSV